MRQPRTKPAVLGPVLPAAAPRRAALRGLRRRKPNPIRCSFERHQRHAGMGERTVAQGILNRECAGLTAAGDGSAGSHALEGLEPSAEHV